jgi:hypothetical protein
MIEVGQLRKIVDEDGIMIGILGGDLLLVVSFKPLYPMVEVLMQNGMTRRFSDRWMSRHTVVVDG